MCNIKMNLISFVLESISQVSKIEKMVLSMWTQSKNFDEFKELEKEEAKFIVESIVGKYVGELADMSPKTKAALIVNTELNKYILGKFDGQNTHIKNPIKKVLPSVIKQNIEITQEESNISDLVMDFVGKNPHEGLLEVAQLYDMINDEELINQLHEQVTLNYEMAY